jgi:CubicO group peptidase (beta-lactamase class C family)
MSFIKTILFSLIISSCSASLQNTSTQLEDAIKPQIANGQFRSIIVGVYEENLQERYYSYGNISKINKKNPNSKNIYEIGSISKVFTGLILSSLHLNGTLSINDKVSTILKSLKGKPAGNITLIELATHMSGLTRLPSNLKNVDVKDPYAKYTSTNLLDYLKSLKSITKPSTFSWNNYSNTGFGLLGYVLQKKTKLTYEELVKKYVTGPLGMSDTYVNVPLNKAMYLVTGHNELLEKTPYWLLQSSMNGAGAIKSNASDLMIFLKANVSPENTDIEDVLRFSQKPRYFDGNTGIGIAWNLKLKDNKVKEISHNGGTGGFVSELKFDKNKKKGFISLTNTSNMSQCVYEVIMTSQDCLAKLSRPIDNTLLTKYVGTYTNKESGLTFILTKHYQQLVYSLPGQEMGIMASINDTEFSIKGIAFIRFNQGDNKFQFEQGKAKLIFTKKE